MSRETYKVTIAKDLKSKIEFLSKTYGEKPNTVVEIAINSLYENAVDGATDIEGLMPITDILDRIEGKLDELVPDL